MKTCPFCRHEVEPIVLGAFELCPNCKQTLCQGCGGSNPDEPLPPHPVAKQSWISPKELR